MKNHSGVWYICEFGAAPPLVVAAFAIYFWSERYDLPPTQSP